MGFCEVTNDSSRDLNFIGLFLDAVSLKGLDGTRARGHCICKVCHSRHLQSESSDQSEHSRPTVRMHILQSSVSQTVGQDQKEGHCTFYMGHLKSSIYIMTKLLKQNKKLQKRRVRVPYFYQISDILGQKWIGILKYVCPEMCANKHMGLLPFNNFLQYLSCDRNG